MIFKFSSYNLVHFKEKKIIILQKHMKGIWGGFFSAVQKETNLQNGGV